MVAVTRRTPAVSPPAKSPCLKYGVIVSSMMRRAVGQVAFETVADFDAQLAVVLGDQEQHAVVLALLAEPPGFDDTHRILLDAFRLRARYQQDGHLRTVLVFKGLQLRLEALPLVAG